MLLSRVLTALILLPLAIYGILFLSNAHFALVVGIIMLLGAYEWAGFFSVKSMSGKLLFAGLVAITLYLMWHFFLHIPVSWMLFISSLFWLFSLYLVIAYPKSASLWKNNPVIIAVLGLVLMVLTWFALVTIHALPAVTIANSQLPGPYLVLSVMILIWLADTGAYFSGRRFGRKKLAPNVSPGKSREGVYGGLILSILVVFVFTFMNSGSMLDYILLFTLSLVTVLFSVVGDLMESMFKRQAGIKDSGQILPGHGGVLDRIDSVTAAGPVFLVALSLLY
jgi:phosphatidate cytidylyltransferase